MYQYKQDLASAYFPDNSKETASKRFAHEIHSNKPLMAALQTTGYSRPNQTIFAKNRCALGRTFTREAWACGLDR